MVLNSNFTINSDNIEEFPALLTDNFIENTDNSSAAFEEIADGTVVKNDDQIGDFQDSYSSEGSEWSPKDRYQKSRKKKSQRRKRNVAPNDGASDEYQDKNNEKSDAMLTSYKYTRPRGRPRGSKNKVNGQGLPSVKSFICTICEEEFVSLYRLKKHQRDHELDNVDGGSFECGVCSKKFLQKRTLQVHLRIHCEDKPYTCNSCGTGFNQFINLQTHERVHSGERPYKCNYCRMTFRQLTNLQQHERRMHNQ